MKDGQKTAEEILRNVQKSDSVNSAFLDFLASLGWPVNVWHHTGWTGRLSTSWRSQHEPMVPPTMPNHGGATFNGDHHVLYWADSESEIAFMVPTKIEAQTIEEPSNHPKLQRQTSSVLVQDTKVVVVWMENFDEISNFPAENLLTENGLNHMVLIFVYVMSNELLKVRLKGHGGKLVLPLLNDMIMPKCSLGPLVRQTVVNFADRRRLDFDNYQPPLVRRRCLIQEIRHKYSNNLTEADLFTELFTEN